MKKYISILIVSGFLIGCGGAQTVSVAPADSADLQTIKLQQKSDSERIAKLEKEMTELKDALERSQRQSKQLGESYDTLVGMFKDYKQMMVNMMDNVGRMMKSEPKDKDAVKGN